MHDLANGPAMHGLVKALWLLTVALAAVLGASMVNARSRLTDLRQALDQLKRERDEALMALASSHEARQQLELRLALESDDLRRRMAAIGERLAEARGTRSHGSPDAEPRIGESRRPGAAPLVGEAPNEPRTWSEPR